MIRFIAFTIAIMAATSVTAQDILIEDGYVRSTNGRSGAAFLVLRNMSDADDKLIAVTSDAARIVTLHGHEETEDGVMRMREIAGGVVVPAGQSHLFARGGDHIMLMGLTAPVEEGDMLTFTFHFDSGAELVAELPVDNARVPEARSD